MRFEFKSADGFSFLEAFLEPGEDGTGRRWDGVRTQTRLSNLRVLFDYEVENIHPDLLGLICLNLFFPYMREEVEFPMPVSSRLQEAFRLPRFTHEKELKFRNVSADVPQYSGTRIANSFGGGFDSTAIRQMFPEAYIVHEGKIRDNEIVPSHTVSVVDALGEDAGRVVYSNSRNITESGGWPTWPCCTNTSLLMATDLDVGTIFIGQHLGSTYLLQGTRFWDRSRAKRWHGPTGNCWQSAFEAVGIPLISPVAGITDLQTMALSQDFFQRDEVVCCYRANGRECHECPKCFRRDLMRSLLSEDVKIDWDRYDNKRVHRNVELRPLRYAYTYATMLMVAPERMPSWLRERLVDIEPVETAWTMKLFAQSFADIPEPWRELVQQRVSDNVESMGPAEIAELMAFDQTLGLHG